MIKRYAPKSTACQKIGENKGFLLRTFERPNRNKIYQIACLLINLLACVRAFEAKHPLLMSHSLENSHAIFIQILQQYTIIQCV